MSTRSREVWLCATPQSLRWGGLLSFPMGIQNHSAACAGKRARMPAAFGANPLQFDESSHVASGTALALTAGASTLQTGVHSASSAAGSPG
eukprot:6176793-Pleurochrysis_carterae.AAC.2